MPHVGPKGPSVVCVLRPSGLVLGAAVAPSALSLEMANGTGANSLLGCRRCEWSFCELITNIVGYISRAQYGLQER